MSVRKPTLTQSTGNNARVTGHSEAARSWRVPLNTLFSTDGTPRGEALRRLSPSRMCRMLRDAFTSRFTVHAMAAIVVTMEHTVHLHAPHHTISAHPLLIHLLHPVMTAAVQLAGQVLIDADHPAVPPQLVLQSLDRTRRRLLDDACAILIRPVSEAHQGVPTCLAGQILTDGPQHLLGEHVALEFEVPEKLCTCATSRESPASATGS